MVKFLTTTEVTAEIEKLIKEAEKKVTLISPFVDIPRALLQNLQSACEQNVEIVLIYGKRQSAEDSEELKSEIKNQLSQLHTLTLRYLDNLHAKCYFNEHHMVITSMNLYDYSAHQNREMGILVSAKDDKEVFDDAVREANDIIGRATPKSLKRNVLVDGLKGLAKAAKSIADSTTETEPKRPKSRPYSYKPRTKREGYFCIRCRTSIPYNLEAPYCLTCYKKWSEGGGNPDYIERHGSCHTCGRPAPTSKARPQCISCYKPRR